MFQDFEVDGQSFRLDETAPYSAVEQLWRHDTEVAGLSRLLNLNRDELLALPWPIYKQLAREVMSRIFPFDRPTD